MENRLCMHIRNYSNIEKRVTFHSFGRRLRCLLKYLIVGFIFLFQPPVFAQQAGDEIPLWTEGYLDIHHINTGKGDAAFFILPDGTTMIVDAGANTRPPGGPREPDAKPNNTRTPGEWISRYIMHMLQDRSDQKIDYILITHFHSDHMGGVYPGIISSESGAYMLSGITEVGDRLSFGKIIDRAWPDYNWPTSLENDDINNYRRFLEWQIENNGVVAEQFNVGKNDQVSLVHNPEKYPNFEIRNIVANGKIWTGTGTNTRNHYPPIETIPEEDLPTENMSGLALRLSYGTFDYFSGGDLVGVPPPGTPDWHDIETPVAKAVGPVDVNVTNHHAHFDAQNEFFLSTLRPRVQIIQSWVVNHPAPSTLRRMLSTRLYPGPRDIFSTNLMEETKIFIGSGSDRINGPGHIVIRVQPDGELYNVFLLEDADESFTIKAVYGPFKSN